MSLHIEANKNEISETVLLPGDPLRAKYIAENFLQDVICYNNVRNEQGYTGSYKGEKISVQATGMGIPSATLYVNELINEYQCKTLIRVGTCGTIQADINLRDIIIAQAATTDSNIIGMEFDKVSYSPIATFNYVNKAYENTKKHNLKAHVGNVFTSDDFYLENKLLMDKLRKFGVLGVDMETAGLYFVAAKYNVQTMSIMTVSDHLITGEKTTTEERQTSFDDMINIALRTVVKNNA